MITIEDCLALSGLTEEEIDAIAEHEHLPEIIAAELGNYLAHRPGGVQDIRSMISDDIAVAKLRGDQRHAHRLTLVLMHFCRDHPSSPIDMGDLARRTA
jgi:hypothetical protein